jgi:hypothetical protein
MEGGSADRSASSPAQVALRAFPGDNLSVAKTQSSIRSPARAEMRVPFQSGALVIATLCNPREKFWGMILALAPEGLSLSGAELASFEDLTVMVKDGEPFTPAVVFFPMHRIERVELDLPDGNLPSLSQRFLSKTGLEPSVALTPASPDLARSAADSPSTRASRERT